MKTCRKRLFSYIVLQYETELSRLPGEAFLNTLEFILRLNIVHGDALTMRYTESSEPLHFSQWSPVPFPRRFSLKRHDFQYQYLVDNAGSPYQSLQEFKGRYFLDIEKCRTPQLITTPTCFPVWQIYLMTKCLLRLLLPIRCWIYCRKNCFAHQKPRF